MKSLLVSAALIFALTVCLQAQTNAPATATTVKTDVPKPDATSANAKPTEPYPVTAIIVSNTITFPVLLSAKSEPLMTNAVYRRIFGRKLIFAADLELKSFDIDKLHPSVIAQLDLDPSKVKSDQENLDKQNQEWAAQRAQQNQQTLSADAAALAKAQAAAQTSQPSTTNGPPVPGAGGGGGKTHHAKKTTPPPAN